MCKTTAIRMDFPRTPNITIESGPPTGRFIRITQTKRLLRLSGEQLIYRVFLLEAKLLITEVTCEGDSAVTAAGNNDLAVGLNEDRVSKGFATAECCAYKAAVTERRV